MVEMNLRADANQKAIKGVETKLEAHIHEMNEMNAKFDQLLEMLRAKIPQS